VIKDCIWSLAGGVILPAAYFFVLALFEDYAAPSSRKVLQLPVSWPRLIYFQIFTLDPNSPSFYDTFDPYLFVFLIVCNILAYGLFVYVTLAAIAAIKGRA